MKGLILSRMLVLATTKHQNQFDKGGNPYILHPLKVMYYLKTDDEELQCIALGHDLLEDTKTTIKDLREIGCSERIVNAIVALTKFPGETHDEYKARVFANRDAMLVKKQDLRHNTDIRRLKGIKMSDFERMQKYHTFYTEIEEKLNERR